MSLLIYKKVFLMLLYLNPLILQFSLFNTDYCSVKEQEYIYNTSFSTKPLENYFDDMLDDSDIAETLADVYFELNHFNNESERWIIQVKSISSNMDYYFKGNVNYYKMLRLKIYEVRDIESMSRRTIFKNLGYKLYEPNYEFQAKLIQAITEYPTLNLHFFYANNMEYDKYCSEINDYIDSDLYEFSAEKINLNFNTVGYKLVYYDDTFQDTNDLIWIMRYNDDGILYLGSLTYENEFIFKFELKDFNIIWYENWILISIVLMIVIALIILYYYIQYKMN